VSRNPLPPHLRRVGIACAFATLLLLCPLPASGGLIWDIGAGIGYAALVFAVALYLYPLRSDGLPHRRLFTLSQHRRIGWIALYLAGLHAVILLVAQPLIGHYLLPSAPLYMLCGLAALIALAILVATGISARSALRQAAHSRVSPPSVATHAVLAAMLLGLMGAHMIGSGQLVDKPSKAIVACLLLALPLFWCAFRPRSTRSHARLLPTVLPCSVAAVVLLLLPLPTATLRLLQPATTPSTLRVNFPHDKHTTVNCVTCHHNFLDKTGIGSCLDCHRGARPDLPQAAEPTFHVFCRDCHRQLALEARTKHGPVRACSGCHSG
jgi:Class III cytochrome C family